MSTDKPSYRALFTPKLLTVLREGYGLADLQRDALAGLTVAVVALPLSMALAIASGSDPGTGFTTAIVAGLIVSLFGGSRFQIAGPTGAFIPVVYAVIQHHGMDGLLLATIMAGLILMAAALMKVGTLMKYIPQPLITGFTAGIAVIIFSSQLNDFFGLGLHDLPAEFVPKIKALAGGFGSVNVWATGIAAGSMLLIFGLRRFAPRAPGFLIAVVLASLLAAWLQLPVDTIGSRFGELPSSLPLPSLPAVSWERIVEMLPAALTIAFLGGMESLLSAVVADGMTGGRHRSNAELLAQGGANIASALFAGLPATGAIARTATNIRSGGRSPVAGALHSVFILVFVLGASRLAAYVPLPALAGVLMVVAWNMSEREHFRHTLSAPMGDRLVLLVTFALTVLVDLTIAIEVGMVIAAFAFMHRMSEVVEISSGVRLIDEPEDELGKDSEQGQRAILPAGVEAFRISGPLFFGAASRLDTVLDRFTRPPAVFILRMGLVPIIDASGVHSLKTLAERCRRQGTRLIVSGLRKQPHQVLRDMHIGERQGELHFVGDFNDACVLAERLLGEADATGASAS